MASSRLNVLVYAGPGCTIESVRHCVFTLRRLLSPRYAVLTVTAEALINEPWPPTCALLVLPGGADMGYCRALNGAGNRRIQRFVEVQGGAYLGFCAGGYYGTARCEFEVDDSKLAVVGRRELAFFPGTCRGCAYGGFKYHSEDGARAVELAVEKTALPGGAVPAVFGSYYNGGGVFVDAPKFAEQGVEVLASYTEKLHVEPGEGMAAIVYCKVGNGGAILTGPHPEFAGVNLNADADGPAFSKIVDNLRTEDEHRTDFLKACLSKLCLNVNQEQNAVPSLSRMHVSSNSTDAVSEFVAALQDIVSPENGEEYIKDENDTFHLEKPSAWSTASLGDSLRDASVQGGDEPQGESADAEDRIFDYSKLTKRVVIHEEDLPLTKQTPYFNHHAYFSNLSHYQSQDSSIDPLFGRLLMYSEVITSTNTILEKNTQLLRRLPSGFLATATIQVAGRGRGNNVWVSPAGSLLFSLVVRHPMSLMPKAPVVFLQYLAAIAIVEGVHGYDKGYEKLPIKLKWPNDIYALDPSRPPADRAYVKIGGILVNSHYSSTEYLSVIGIGLNATNALPTTSLVALLPPGLPAFTPEKLLARLVTTFSALYGQFCETGFDARVERTYYRHWLHAGQVVTLETEGGTRARIKGITRDWGLLVAEELEDGIDGERATGRTVELQSDSNSFDFFKGLVKRKT